MSMQMELLMKKVEYLMNSLYMDRCIQVNEGTETEKVANNQKETNKKLESIANRLMTMIDNKGLGSPLHTKYFIKRYQSGMV